MESKLVESFGYKFIADWLSIKGRHPFLFQQQTWLQIINNESGLVNAPTGCGKTYSVSLVPLFIISTVRGYVVNDSSEDNYCNKGCLVGHPFRFSV